MQLSHRILIFILVIFSMKTQAQTPSLTSSEILRNMQKLGTIGSVLYVAAHPDDENTRLLTYLSKEKNVRTAYLSLTRGDGGQNLIGKEQGELLGLLRTQELLAARRVDGAEQFFTRANDFGYSKNPEETFSFWNKDSILSDVVYTIRRFRPDVIICRFPTTGEGGHGHHTASALLAKEAFEVAAEPKMFSDQLSQVSIWKTKRIYVNTFNFGSTNTTSPDQLKIDVGGYNALLGKSYGEISAESRSMHRSQGFGSAKTRGENMEYFKFMKGDSVTNDLFENIDLSWRRLIRSNEPGTLIDDCCKKFDPAFPEKSIPQLLTIYKTIRALNDADPEIAYWKQIKLRETEDLILACSGLWMEATASEFSGVPGKNTELTAQFISRNSFPVKLNSITWAEQTDTAIGKDLKKNELLSIKHSFLIPVNASFSNPYWLDEKHPEGSYVIRNRKQRCMAQNEIPLTLVFKIQLSDLEFSIARPLTYKYTDPSRGELYRPFEILPPATINFSEKVVMLTGKEKKKIHLTVKANVANLSGTLRLKAPSGWMILLKDSLVNLTSKGDEQPFEAELMQQSGNNRASIVAEVQIGNTICTKSIARVEYDHIPSQFMLHDAELTVQALDLVKTQARIGYIPGAGDDVPAALQQIGYTVTTLSDDILLSSDLNAFDAIITGVRAYNTNARLQIHYPALMSYIKNGGNFIVQYNTNNRIGPLQAKIGPFPFTISRDRVTDEHAEVRFLDPQHPVLNSPNKISHTDFENWIQERGIYFATDCDSSYRKIFSMNDAGEKAGEGSLIIAPYGKGNFVYTGLDFFRELPAGVPGAYRLFVNLISLPKNP